jgi:hypothetical protein
MTSDAAGARRLNGGGEMFCYSSPWVIMTSSTTHARSIRVAMTTVAPS